MNRDHLRRLDSDSYRGQAVAHWTMAIRDRRVGWLDPRMYYRFRELLTHSQFRHSIACPIFTMMPDHIHFIWMGLSVYSDQKLAMRHLRNRFNQTLSRIGFELQDQPFDNVLQEDELQEEAFKSTCEYIARNPERAALVAMDDYARYPYSGCLIPGYPELRPFAADFWTRFERSVAYIRKSGVIAGQTVGSDTLDT